MSAFSICLIYGAISAPQNAFVSWISGLKNGGLAGLY
jgi:hypothetical protein